MTLTRGHLAKCLYQPAITCCAEHRIREVCPNESGSRAKVICLRSEAVLSTVNVLEPSQMQTSILFGTTAVVFLALDAVMLKFVMRPLFEQYLGNLLLNEIRFGPAITFYLFYVAGLLWLVSLPALRADLPIQALFGGAVLGAMAYGTYEFTNYATLRAWSPQMVAVDVAWGTVLTAVSAWLGVTVTRAIT